MNNSKSSTGLKIGRFGIGLDAYWPQFPGLEARLKGYLQQVAEKIGVAGADVVNLGRVRTSLLTVGAGEAEKKR